MFRRKQWSSLNKPHSAGMNLSLIRQNRKNFLGKVLKINNLVIEKNRLKCRLKTKVKEKNTFGKTTLES